MEGKIHWVKIADTADMVPGTGFEGEIDGETISLFEIDGTYHALGACTHEQGPLSQGIINDGTVSCPWHGATFDIRTGACLQGPIACRVDGSVHSRDSIEMAEHLPACATYEVNVDNGRVYIKVKAKPNDSTGSGSKK